MRPIFLTFSLLFLLTSAVVVSQQKITDATITFNFVAKDVEGSLTGFDSKSIIDWDNPENTQLVGSVDTSTIKTGNFLRDWSLKGASYFNVADFSKITFKSSEVSINGSSMQVKGILTLKGISNSIQLDLKKNGNKLQGTTTLLTTDYDITILKKNKESNRVLVNFDFTLE